MTKVEAARQEYIDWCTAVGVSNLESLNFFLESGRGIELINLCEARQERKYAQLADQIYWKKNKARIVLMSGPSSSGKTSSSLRIAQQCRVLGLNPKVVELDNYFVDRSRTPKDENGNFDFECLEAIDTELLQRHFSELLEGREVIIPRFDFHDGRSIRDDESRRLRLEDSDILFMEGIHALNPELLGNVDPANTFRIYISSLSALPGGEKAHNSTTDKRLLRRIVRDSRTRGHNAESTILQWPSVRRGEELYIFPYEENADCVFNSSTLYDVPLLGYYASPLLLEIAESSPAYEKAQTLLGFIDKVRLLTPREIAAIPPVSIMREFIGGQML